MCALSLGGCFFYKSEHHSAFPSISRVMGILRVTEIPRGAGAENTVLNEILTTGSVTHV